MQSDGADIFAIMLLCGLTAAVGFAAGIAMGKRDKKLREKGRQPEHLIVMIAREAIRERYGKDIDELPKSTITKIHTAVLDAQPAGLEAMQWAAIAEYRYRTQVATWTKEPTGEEEE